MNELFDRCLANVNPDTKAEVRKNMKTIAERADITFPYEEGDDWAWANHEGYIKGATEAESY